MGKIVERSIVYSELPSQARFHASEARFKGFSGPIGSGKSVALCQDAVRAMYVNPATTGLLGAPTFAMLRDAVLVTLTRILHDAKIPYRYNKAERVLTNLDSRSRVLLRPVEEF